MAGRDALLESLEDPWRPVIDAVLRRLRAPSLEDVARLAPRVAELSRAYNQGRAGDSPDRGPLPLEARVAFSFARDVPKGAAAVAELVAAGVLRVPEDRPLRILDLGAGLGAITWGVVRALAEAGAKGAVEALLVDSDADALAAAAMIGDAASKVELGALTLTIRTRTAKLDAATLASLGRADLVLLGQVVSELDTTLEPPARVAKHDALLRTVLATVCERDGSVVVVEPALRDRSRHLHALRDALLTGDAPPVLFAPCLHTGACPMLRTEGDWCHEDRPVDLPPWLVPLARAAGLRFQGLTFSYLVLRREGRTLRELVGAGEPSPGRTRLRVVSEVMASKGKLEIFGCTEGGERLRLRRLDRDATDANAAFETLERGDVVTLRGGGAEGARAVDDRGRLAREAAVDVHRTRS